MEKPPQIRVEWEAQDLWLVLFEALLWSGLTYCTRDHGTTILDTSYLSTSSSRGDSTVYTVGD